MNLIFFGTQDWSAELLADVIKDDFFHVVGVVTQPDKPVGRKHILTPSPVKQVALDHQLLVLQPTKLNDPLFLEQVRAMQPEIAVVIAYGRILPRILIDLVPLGFVNVHPSLLPRWRGPSPIQAAIAAGDQTSGVTIMRIDKHMDHGPILVQTKLNLEEKETPDSFMKKVLIRLRPLFLETLKSYATGNIQPVEQNHEQATICSILTKEMGCLDWNQTAKEIERLIRAYQPWPGTWTTIKSGQKDLRLKILEATVSLETSDAQPGTLFAMNDQLFIACGQKTLLQIVTIQPEGKAPMTAASFVSGYQPLLGSKLGASPE